MFNTTREVLNTKNTSIADGRAGSRLRYQCVLIREARGFEQKLPIQASYACDCCTKMPPIRETRVIYGGGQATGKYQMYLYRSPNCCSCY